MLFMPDICRFDDVGLRYANPTYDYIYLKVFVLFCSWTKCFLGFKKAPKHPAYRTNRCPYRPTKPPP